MQSPKQLFIEETEKRAREFCELTGQRDIVWHQRYFHDVARSYLVRFCIACVSIISLNFIPSGWWQTPSLVLLVASTALMAHKVWTHTTFVREKLLLMPINSWRERWYMEWRTTRLYRLAAFSSVVLVALLITDLLFIGGPDRQGSTKDKLGGAVVVILAAIFLLIALAVMYRAQQQDKDRRVAR